MSAHPAVTPHAGTAEALTAIIALVRTRIAPPAMTTTADGPANIHTPRPTHTTVETSPAVPDADPTATTQPPGAVVRARLLSDVVRQHLTDGAVVESMSAHRVVLRHRRPTNHRRHALRTALTLGAWAPLWALNTAINTTRYDVLIFSVDEHGTINIDAPHPAAASHGRN